MPKIQTIIYCFCVSVSCECAGNETCANKQKNLIASSNSRECDTIFRFFATDVVLVGPEQWSNPFFIAKKLRVQISPIAPHFLFLFFAVIHCRQLLCLFLFY
jgi:hypothetical protein